MTVYNQDKQGMCIPMTMSGGHNLCNFASAVVFGSASGFRYALPRISVEGGNFPTTPLADGPSLRGGVARVRLLCHVALISSHLIVNAPVFGTASATVMFSS